MLGELILWVGITVVQMVVGLFLGCFVGILGLLLWCALIVLHIVCIVKGVNGQRLIVPGVSEYADKL